MTIRSRQAFWIVFASLAVSLIVIGCITWILDHPYGISWDEAEYFDRALGDLARLREGGWGELGRSILLEDRIRPPAYRLLVLPFTISLGFSPVAARLVSLSFFVLSLIFVYLTVRRLAGVEVGAFAVIFLCLNPVMIFSSMVFGTEYPLFLATAATMYFLFADWDNQPESTRNWIGLGLALGLGAWSKTSFALVAGPALALSFFLSFRKIIVGPSPKFLMKATALGFVVAAPWWLLNVRPALWYVRYAGTSRHSLGTPSLENWAKWLSLFAQSILGPTLTLVLVVMFLGLILNRITKLSANIDHTQKTVLLVCFLSSLPYLLQAPVLGTNYNTRYLTPALIVLGVGVGVLAKTMQWTRARPLVIGASMLFGIQLFLTLAPVFHPVIYPSDASLFERPPWLVLARVEQWDWEPLREICQAHGIENPSIAFLGAAREFNWPAITYPWATHRQGMTKVTWLWRLEEGPIDWDQIMSSSGDYDIVLTAPHLVGNVPGGEDMDNQYNAEFAERLEHDLRFSEPIYLTMGRFEPVELAIFVNKAVMAQD